MSSVPERYSHVLRHDAPRLIREAMKLYGVKERPGGANNPVILEWADEVEAALRTNLGYNADSIPWCGLFAAVCAVRAGWKDQTPLQPLWARNWRLFGQRAPTPSLGDVLVFERASAGHVGFYIADDEDAFHVLGGNQGDAVSIVRVEKGRLLAARRPRWRAAQPATVKPFPLGSMGGAFSRNET